MKNQRAKLAYKNTEDDLKILLRILSIYLPNITSLIHTRDWALYAWTSLYTCRIRTAEESREFRQIDFRIGRAAFNPHLRCGLAFLSERRDSLPGVEIYQHRTFTIRGIFRGVVVRRGNLVFVYIGDGNWHRFKLDVLEQLAVDRQLDEEIALARRARG